VGSNPTPSARTTSSHIDLHPDDPLKHRHFFPKLRSYAIDLHRPKTAAEMYPEDCPREDHRLAFRLAGDYAKWFIATLLLLHSGAIAAVFPRADPKLACPTMIFGAGVALALFSALASWLNLFTVSKYFRQSANDVLAESARKPWPRSVTIWMWTAFASIVPSSVALIGGAIFVWLASNRGVLAPR
jgi:hypothetical protein